MTFHLTPARLEALNRLEAETHCTIAAGVDLYRHSQTPETATGNLETESQWSVLTTLVETQWGNVLDPDVVQAIVADVSTYLNEQVKQRLHSEQVQ